MVFNDSDWLEKLQNATNGEFGIVTKDVFETNQVKPAVVVKKDKLFVITRTIVDSVENGNIKNGRTITEEVCSDGTYRIIRTKPIKPQR